MRKILRILLISILGVVLLYFVARNSIASYVFQKVSGEVKNRYGFLLSAGDVSMTGLAGVELHNVVLTPENGDTLLRVDSIYLRPSLPHLVFGKIKLTELNIAELYLHIVGHDSISNYKPRERMDEPGTTKKEGQTNYASLLHRFSRNAFNLCPGKSLLRNVRCEIDLDSIHENLIIPYYIADGDSMHGTLVDNHAGKSWSLAGHYSQDDQLFDIAIVPGDGDVASIPLVKSFTGGYCSLDTLEFRLEENKYASGILTAKGSFSASQLMARHPRLSGDTIRVNKIRYDFVTHIGKDYAEVDSASSITLNSLVLAVYARIDKGGKPVYACMMKSGRQPANNFFSSLPEGMFTEVQGVEAKGDLDFRMDFRMESDHPDDLQFHVQMKKSGFALTRFGRNSLLKMNTEFSHTVYEYGHPVKTFLVGPLNPGFVTADRVSPYVKYAFLTSEDGNFFFHNGFNEEAFRNSIAANYKAGKFVRGGSTISMQLVKNVYLTRNKTVARKVEEALIVWLIESNRLVSKERMFEVYLNIVELGPMIYGVSDASRFYFDKAPADLTLSESIFLASLLPHPKWFKYSFDSTGALKPYLADYYRVMSNFMLKKNLISEEEYNRLLPQVVLKGPAKDMVIPTEPLPADSTDDDD